VPDREKLRGRRKKARRFFFEKKNQKTFPRLRRKDRVSPPQTGKVFFASFFF
jgi:hypothetical protein